MTNLKREEMKKIMNQGNLFFAAMLYGAMLFSINSCSTDTENSNEIESLEEIDDTSFEATDWTTETHTKSVDPNFNEVFDDTAVKRLDIVITPTRWQSILDDMTATYGSFGSQSGNGPGGAGGGGLVDAEENPIFVPAEVYYNGLQWYRVGVRFKGNSSLQSSWSNGIMKLSFKLDFDEFEDDYPQIDNQRFYGFKKLSLKNNYNDKSMMREKVAGDVFRNAGLVGSHTAFYTLYVDYGDGPQYFGVYTMVEEVDDTVLEDQFSDDNGNLYKPDGSAASFTAGTYNEDEYVKKNNEDEADFSDVEGLLNVLHNESRTTNPVAWRTNLETVFDTDVFLKYLAVNTVIQNWDTYGKMTHNYFLYNDSDTNKLTWIPWDNNEALQNTGMGGALPLDFAGLNSSEWPLIGYLYEDSVYKEQYDTYVQEVVDGAFNATAIQAQYGVYAEMLAPYATTEVAGYSFLNTSTDFQSAVNQLNAHVLSRATAVNDYLD